MSTLDVLSKSAYDWWLALFIACSQTAVPSQRVINLLDAGSRQSSGEVLVSSSSVSSSAGIRSISQYDQRTIILWDGQRSFEELRAVEGFDRLPPSSTRLLAVGDVPHSGPWPVKRLFHQNSLRYETAVPLVKDLGRQMTGSIKRIHVLRHRYAYSAMKLATQAPLLQFSKPGTLLFAGQSGRATLQSMGLGRCYGFRSYLTDLEKFELGRKQFPFDLTTLCAELLHLISTDWERNLALRALWRSICLQRIAQRFSSAKMFFYPHVNLNIYQNRLLRQCVFIDLGGVNGSEMLYPRAVDLIAARKTAASFRFGSFDWAARSYGDTAALLSAFVEDQVNRVLMALETYRLSPPN